MLNEIEAFQEYQRIMELEKITRELIKALVETGVPVREAVKTVLEVHS